MAFRCSNHLLVDCWGVAETVCNSATTIEAIVREAVREAGATLLEIKTHSFEPQGVTSFALLAESHIALHSWPEDGYLSFDILMCSGSIERALAVFLSRLKPERYTTHVIERGADSLSPSQEATSPKVP